MSRRHLTIAGNPMPICAEVQRAGRSAVLAIDALVEAWPRDKSAVRRDLCPECVATLFYMARLLRDANRA